MVKENLGAIGNSEPAIDYHEKAEKLLKMAKRIEKDYFSYLSSRSEIEKIYRAGNEICILGRGRAFVAYARDLDSKHYLTTDFNELYSKVEQDYKALFPKQKQVIWLWY